ncbi:MAG TPA: DUF5110 domain-containing protein, partial [Polyangiaceae bacterium]|nr:DUF5110 domain-containing protein [Polyangiaceae bacterium]
PPDPLTLVAHVDDGEDEISLYEDAGDGHEHERGVYARRAVRCGLAGGRAFVEIGARQGQYVPERRTVVVELRGLEQRPRAVRVDGRDASGWDWDGRTLRVELAESARPVAVEAQVG